MSEFTSGPWGWRGNPKGGGIYLASLTPGRPTVMNFRRQGMHAAQPAFPEGLFMKAAVDFCEYEVPYRSDIVGLSHPNARLIETSPELLYALEGVALGHMKTHPDGHLVVLTAETWDRVRLAIARARGTS